MLERLEKAGEVERKKIIDNLIKRFKKMREMESTCREEIAKCKDNYQIEVRIDAVSGFANKAWMKARKSDIRACEKICASEYRDIWDNLFIDSKELVCQAKYVYSMLSATENDMSPVLVQLGKALETELRHRIFDDVIREFYRVIYPNLVEPDTETIEVLNDAINRYAHSARREYRLTAAQMATAINYFESNYHQYGTVFLGVLDDNHWDGSGLSRNFCPKAKTFTDDYRNKAAHASLICKSKVDDGNECFIELMKTFYLCKVV